MKKAANLLVRGEIIMAYRGTQLHHSVCSHRPFGTMPRQTGAAAWMLAANCKHPCCCQTITSAVSAKQGSTHCHAATYTTANATQALDTSVQQQSAASSYVHLGVQQERINADGSLTMAYSMYRQQPTMHPTPSTHNTSNGINPGSSSSSTQQQQQQQPADRPPGLPAAAPAAAPISKAQLEQLADMIQCSRRTIVITGAGCSTESNIPDYRGPTGAYTTGFTPMTHQQFVAKPQNRSRYWARSFAGWHEFAFVKPNAAHEAIARLQNMGWLDIVITQNVDRLHHKGGSNKVLELHGTTHRVVCLDCGDNTCRHDIQQRLAELNPHMAEAVRRASTAAAAAGSSGISNRAAYERALRVGTAADGRKVAAGKDAEQVPVVRPDGDIELGDAGYHFKLPGCSNCGSERLKPDVVFFGDSVPKDRVQRALAAAQAADLVLVVGSSLMVWSAFRLIKAAKEAGARLAIVNVGPTRADDLADIKVEALASEVMMQLAMHPSLLIPRIE